MAKKIVWDDDKLREAVASSTSFNMVAKKVTTNPEGLYKSVQRRIKQLGLDTSHFTGIPRRGCGWTEQDLRIAVATSRSLRQTIMKLGLVAAGGNYDQVQRRIKTFGIDTSHFSGQAWNKGGVYQPVKERPRRP